MNDRVAGSDESKSLGRHGEPGYVGNAESNAILMFISDADGPVGARQIRASLMDAGITISESTTARRLRELDLRGLTRQVGVKGRVITALGAELVARTRRARSARLVAATEVRNTDDLLNVLRARRAIEPEAVRDAAEHISRREIEGLRALIDSHRVGLDGSEPVQPVLSMEFHRRLAEPATNPIVRAIHRLVLDSNLQHVDSTLDIILNHEGLASSVDAHAAILEALERGDGIRAAALMHEHIDTLIRETLDFIAANGSGLVTRMLRGAWVQEQALETVSAEH